MKFGEDVKPPRLGLVAAAGTSATASPSAADTARSIVATTGADSAADAAPTASGGELNLQTREASLAIDRRAPT